MIDAQVIVQILYFFLPAYLANMSPVLVRRWFSALAIPIDGGKTLWGKRLLGDHKTWRGLLAGVIAGMLVFELQRLPMKPELRGDVQQNSDTAGWIKAFGEYPPLCPILC